MPCCLARALMVRQRTQTINSLRGHLAEFGVVAPRGVAGVVKLRQALTAAAPLPEQVAALAELLFTRIASLSAQITGLEQQIRVRGRQRPGSGG